MWQVAYNLKLDFRRLLFAVLGVVVKGGPNANIALGQMVASGPQCAAKSVLVSVCSQCETPNGLSFRRELWGASVGVGIAVAMNAIWIAVLAYAASLMF